MAECSYCFGPHSGNVIKKETIDQIIQFMVKTVAKTNQPKVSITFHGGEPLIAPYDLWEYTLEQITRAFDGKNLKLAIQSNLWNLDDKFCELFKKYKLLIGTSIDGPEAITKVQRGKDYFEKTCRGISLAEQYGLEPGNIATFTPFSIDKAQAVMDYFIKEKKNFSVHPSIKPIGHEGDENLFITTKQFTKLLNELFDSYLKHKKEIIIPSLDEYCKAVAFGEAKVCTFKKCFGIFLAIDPEGYIYPCQRFCGNKEFALGNVEDRPDLYEIENHINAKKIIEREQQVQEACGDCEHINYCHGGCYYNALSGDPEGVIDPFCCSYKEFFSRIKTELAKEISSKENIKAMPEIPDINQKEPFFLQRGEIISLIKNPHPASIAQNAKMVIALHQIAKEPNLRSAARSMVTDKITVDEEETYSALKQIKQLIVDRSGPGNLNNLYIHTTFNCNLRCTHCYANAGAVDNLSFMEIEKFNSLLNDSKENGFRQAIITGGEPLIHPEIEKMLEMTSQQKNNGIKLVLRTNLTGDYSDDFLKKLSTSFDQIVVSVDGNEKTHDQRRGMGSYKNMRNNITRYQNLFRETEGAELSLSCVMNKDDIKGAPGAAVRELGDELRIKRLRFKPLLPLGRAEEYSNPPVSEAVNAHINPSELLKQKVQAKQSCGLGQNLYIEPSGDSFPCYAYHKPHSLLGNVFKTGLSNIISSAEFQKLGSYDVDHIEKCKTCEYRYLCGGACRAWSGEDGQNKLDAAPIECDGLKNRAREIITEAYKNISDTD